MQLLVSVTDAAEARAALEGGADVIDAKDPQAGALGAVEPGALAAIRAAVGSSRPTSAALGDSGSPAAFECLARTAAALGVEFVKAGFRGVGTARAARRVAAATRRGAGADVRVVLVGYADWRRVGCLAPDALLPVAVESGASGVLLDTAVKDVGLFELLAPGAVRDWVAAAHASGLFACVAGRLGPADFAAAGALGADIVGVRGAACVGGRTGRVSAARVAALRALAGAAVPSAAVALV